MTNFNPENERIKKAYFIYLKEADQKADATIDAIRKAILRLEQYTNFKPFKTYNKEQAIAFKKHLTNTLAERSGRPLAKHTMLSTLNAIKAFLRWLRLQAGFKTCIKALEIEYLNLSEKETRAAQAPKNKEFPTLEQIRTTIASMPRETDIEKRDRALIAFTILTGMRDSAIASLKLKHIDINRCYVEQNPSEVKTKFSKKIDTFFFPIGDDIKNIFTEWVSFLKEEKHFGLEAPLFPQTKLGHDENKSFKPMGLEPSHWQTTTPIRSIFKAAFLSIDLPYFTPHMFRNTLVHIGQKKCTTPEEFKAWSQNLGHDSPLTTFTSYGQIDPYKQGDLIKGLGQKKDKEDKLDAIYTHLIQNK